MRTDDEVARAVATIEPRRQRWMNNWWNIRGEDRRAFLADVFDFEQDDLRPQELVASPVTDTLCPLLAARDHG